MEFSRTVYAGNAIMTLKSKDPVKVVSKPGPSPELNIMDPDPDISPELPPSDRDSSHHSFRGCCYFWRIR